MSGRLSNFAREPAGGWGVYLWERWTMKKTIGMRWIAAAGFVVVMAMASAALGAAPKVVKATPDNGEKDVDPATRELRIVFDQPMSRDGYSVVGGGESYPKTIGKPTWANDRTFVLSMRLEPNHEYWLSINSDRFTNFRSKTGEIAEPYPISFRTAAGKAAAAATKLTAAENRKAIEQLRRGVDEDYSYRDRLKVDWGKLFKEASPMLEAAETQKQFALGAAKMLGAAEDMHLWLKVGEELIPSFRRSVAPNMNMISVSNAVPGFKRVNNAICSGRFEDGIVYVLIATWANERAKDIEAIYEVLGSNKGAKGLIVDVRANAGGDDMLASQFAGCFVDQAKPFAKDVTRSNGQFGTAVVRMLEPNRGRPEYRGKIAVLMGPANMSSCESFLLMMKQVPGCKLVGARSFGSSGNPKPQTLENGVVVFLPSWQDMLLDGTCFEGKGIEPDIAVKAEPGEFLRGDPVLDAALKHLRGGVAK